MRGKDQNVEQRGLQNEAIQELNFDISDVSNPKEREVYLRHIIASFQEIDNMGEKRQIKFTVDLLPDEVLLFERAKGRNGKRLFEAGGIVRLTKLHIEKHTFRCL